MQNFTVQVRILASADDAAFAKSLSDRLECILHPIVAFCLEFLRLPVTPIRAMTAERELFRFVRDVGRVLLEFLIQNSEPEDADLLPPRVKLGVFEYRRRRRTYLPLSTIFGVVRIQRFLYESIPSGDPSIFPLDRAWGVGVGGVSTLLTERIVRLANDHAQRDVLRILRDDYGVPMSVKRLRKVFASTAERVQPLVFPSRVDQILALLTEANASQGKHRITLSVGRDGCSIPIRFEGYKVAAVATISAFNRKGKRVGTVYLAQMPQEHQANLTRELNAVLRGVLIGWKGPLPRLVYITDSGKQETTYWSQLRCQRHPLTGKKLEWERIADFYHTCQYISKLSAVLFDDEKQGRKWFRKMRHWLRDEPNGARRVIHSAAALLTNREPLTSKARKEYETGVRYLSKRLRFLNYADYRKRGLPIGSGVTEAACKTVFTQRFKRSGMKWSREGGHPILQLRTLVLSGIWPKTFEAALLQEELDIIVFSTATKPTHRQNNLQNAA